MKHAFSFSFVFVAFCCSVLILPEAARATSVADAALTAPPSGLTLASVRLADILALHQKSVGTLTGEVQKGVSEGWTFTDSGISGTEQLDRSRTNYRSKITRGPFSEEFGQFNDKRWHLYDNGLSSPTQASNFKFSNLSYQDQSLLATDVPFETSYNSTDAVLGYDVIGYYDVYFALGYGNIYLRPNRWFHEHFKTTANH